MRHEIFLYAVLGLAVMMTSCADDLTEEGVSRALASERKAAMADLRYSLRFDIPDDRDSSVEATETVRFRMEKKSRVIMDMKGVNVHSVEVNGITCTPDIRNGHLILPGKFFSKGDNSVNIVFTAGEQSLNRREKFLYTLLVPDRARTLFPCFDQPDLKARYTLSLTVPEGWTAVSNAPVRISEGKLMEFEETEPLSTYLFSFVAGEFECVTVEGMEAAGHPIHLYHRETDPERIAQCPEILGQVKASIEWLEEYTGIEYPFAKYDLVVLPDFQYGGMEHTGATLYNDKRIFLGPRPTTEELLGRASLIAHETAHMWFGDLVTMKWFDDVWTKEVFANYFAAKMVRPLFPDIDHTLNDLKDFYAAAYSEDRTSGSNAIQRPLANLRDAGLIYCNIIYDKSPVVMSMLEKRIGGEHFRSGIRKYLNAFAYGNATWDDLIAIMDASEGFDLSRWSRVWVKERGMPGFSCIAEGNKIEITQTDPFRDGNVWQEEVTFTLLGADGKEADATAVFDGGSVAEVEVPFTVAHIVPNSDGSAYGWFRLTESEACWLQEHYAQVDNDVTRMSLLMTLYENTWHGVLSPESFVKWACRALRDERNVLICNSMLNYASSADRWAGGLPEFETALTDMAADVNAGHEFRLAAFRTLIGKSRASDGQMLEIWSTEKPFAGMTLSERDYTSMAYQLMLRFPDRASEIRGIQAGRITNPDRKEAFLYISQACSADRSERDAFFESLLHASTRGAESRVTAALSLLNSPLHPREESVSRIRPALDALEEVQRTGDIFFPSTWCSALLENHTSEAAAEKISGFISDNPGMNPLLMTKVLQKAGRLLSSPESSSTESSPSR